MTIPLASFRFEVSIMVENGSSHGLSNPLCSAAFAECSGLEASMTPKTIEEGGNNVEQVHLVGPVTYSQLTLKRGMTQNLDLWRWFTAVTRLGSPTGARADVEVKVLMDRYHASVGLSARQYERDKKAALTGQQAAVLVWLVKRTEHPCMMPLRFLRAHTDQIVNLSLGIDLEIPDSVPK